ncbi:hypothetical protein ACO0QE_004486 [Hanseniaspora vineae]
MSQYQSPELNNFITILNTSKPDDFIAFGLKYFSGKAVEQLSINNNNNNNNNSNNNNNNNSNNNNNNGNGNTPGTGVFNTSYSISGGNNNNNGKKSVSGVSLANGSIPSTATHRGSIFKSPFVDTDPHTDNTSDVSIDKSANTSANTRADTSANTSANTPSNLFKGDFNVGNQIYQNKEPELDPRAPNPSTSASTNSAITATSATSDEKSHGKTLPFNFNAQRRTSVSGETIQPEKDDIEMRALYERIKKTNNKTQEQLDRLSASVGENFLFKKLDTDSKKLVITALVEKHIKKGETIIKQGDEGDFFYIVENGQVEFYVNGTKVSTSGAGSSFGELALMYNSPRAATVVASTDCELWCLDRLTFRKILLGRSFKKRILYDEFLKKVPILSTLTTYDRAKLADALNTEFYSKGDVIIKEGDVGENFYFIEYGSASVLKKGHEKPLTILQKGDYFGEVALLNDLPRQATVTADENTKVVTLGKSGFQRLLGPVVEVLKLHDPTRK